MSPTSLYRPGIRPTAAALIFASIVTTQTSAQYVGSNKVQYETPDLPYHPIP